MDYYFKPDDIMPRAVAPITGKEYPDHNHPDTLDLSRMLNDLENAMQSAEIIIIEGAMALSIEEIHKQLDLKVFIDCKADERIVRRLKRYKHEWNTLIEDDSEIFGRMADIYLDLVRYRHDEFVEPSKWRADIILNGSTPSDKALDMVKDYVVAMA